MKQATLGVFRVFFRSRSKGSESSGKRGFIRRDTFFSGCFNVFLLFFLLCQKAVSGGEARAVTFGSVGVQPCTATGSAALFQGLGGGGSCSGLTPWSIDRPTKPADQSYMPFSPSPYPEQVTQGASLSYTAWRNNSINCACRARSPQATTAPPLWAGPPSQEVITPPAPSMIGISACTS